MRLTMAMLGAGLALCLAGAANAQDAAAGKAAFGPRCGTCHQVDSAKSGLAGPSLKGVFGRKVAGLSDFAYSAGLKGKGGVWTAANLDAFLASPVKFAPGGKMFTAVTDPKDRANLIAYLKSAK